MIFTPKTLNEAQGDGIPINWAARLIKTHRHWWRTEGAGVKIAILDSGINLEHPAFDGAIAAYKNFTGGDENDVTDDTGHGTHSAGIIAAREIAPDGMSGIAQKAELYVVKVTKNGKGSWENVISAIGWVLAVNREIDSNNDQRWEEWKENRDSNPDNWRAVELESKISLVQISVVGDNPPEEFLEMLSKAIAGGICLVTSEVNLSWKAGIEGEGTDNQFIVVVGEQMHFESEKGSIEDQTVRFLAPDRNIWTTSISGGESATTGKSVYQKMSGKSLSPSFVTGLAAMMLSSYHGYSGGFRPRLLYKEMKSDLLKLVDFPCYVEENGGYAKLLPFLKWRDLTEPDPFAVTEMKAIFYRKCEAESERDDRVDMYRLEDLDYWRQLQKSESGRYWAGISADLLKETILAQSKQVGYLLNLSLFKKAGGKLKEENEHIIFSFKSYNQFVKDKYDGKGLCAEERFQNQLILPGRTVFFAGESIFYTVHHGIAGGKWVGPPKFKSEEPYERKELENYLIVLGFIYRPGNDSVSISIPKYQILDCVHAIGGFGSGVDKDWMIIHSKPRYEAGANPLSNLQRIKEYQGFQRKQLFNDNRLSRISSAISRYYSIAHTSRLPMKFIPDGETFSEYMAYYTLDLSYGASGAPIFDVLDFSIKGIQSQGLGDGEFDDDELECIKLSSGSTPHIGRSSNKYQHISLLNEITPEYSRWLNDYFHSN